METNDYIYAHPLLKGQVIINPSYNKQELEEYSDNPFIEALPNIFTEEEIANKFIYYPKIEERDRNMPAHIRYHMIKRIKNFSQMLEIHFRIEGPLSAMIRRGYIARNPCSNQYFQRLQLLNDVKNEKEILRNEKFNEIAHTLRSTADSLSIIGISGIGKTTALEKILLMYPQVIQHCEYKAKPLTRTQIVWLKIDCPYDGSIKTLCKLFFKTVDDILGTTRYFEKYGNNRNSAATMMMHMTYLASVHSIGLMVIDEIQHLINPKNNPDEMLNFFVTLVNTIGIPTILVGTFKALKVLKRDFRQARRAGSEGIIIWDRMKQKEELGESDWEFFLDTLWRFQYLKNITPLTQEINDVMYDESQGITAVAVNLFILAQERTLYLGTEKLSTSLIRRTAQEDLSVIQPMIRALRHNNIDEIQQYEDISITLEDVIKTHKREIELQGKIKEFSKQIQQQNKDKKENLELELFLELYGIGIFDKLTNKEMQNIVSEAISNGHAESQYTELKKEMLKLALNKLQEKEQSDNKIVRTKKTNLRKYDLRRIFKDAQEKHVHIYDLLCEGGMIKNPIDEFLKAE